MSETDEPRYTREEWEEIDSREEQAYRERAREQGHAFVSVHFNGYALLRMSIESRDALIAAKLDHVRISILKMLEEL